MKMLNNKSGFICPENILLVIELHTIVVMLFYSFMSPLYIFSGASILFLKGVAFFILFGGDMFAVIDVICSLFLVLLVWDVLPGFLWTIIFVYLIVKTLGGFLHIGHHH